MWLDEVLVRGRATAFLIDRAEIGAALTSGDSALIERIARVEQPRPQAYEALSEMIDCYVLGDVSGSAYVDGFEMLCRHLGEEVATKQDSYIPASLALQHNPFDLPVECGAAQIVVVDAVNAWSVLAEGVGVEPPELQPLQRWCERSVSTENSVVVVFRNLSFFVDGGDIVRGEPAIARRVGPVRLQASIR